MNTDCFFGRWNGLVVVLLLWLAVCLLDWILKRCKTKEKHRIWAICFLILWVLRVVNALNAGSDKEFGWIVFFPINFYIFLMGYMAYYSGNYIEKHGMEWRSEDSTFADKFWFLVRFALPASGSIIGAVLLLIIFQKNFPYCAYLVDKYGWFFKM